MTDSLYILGGDVLSSYPVRTSEYAEDATQKMLDEVENVVCGLDAAIDRRCPQCGAAAKSWCRCLLGDTKYVCGHETNICPRHKCVNMGPSDHANPSVCTCPPLTHCTDRGVL